MRRSCLHESTHTLDEHPSMSVANEGGCEAADFIT